MDEKTTLAPFALPPEQQVFALTAEPTAPEPTAPRQRRGRKPGRKATPVQETTPRRKPGRPPGRKAAQPAPARASRTAMIPRAAFGAVKDLKEDEFHLTMQIADAVNALPKKARARVVGALGKLVQA